jgi:hypothetical protein
MATMRRVEERKTAMLETKSTQFAEIQARRIKTMRQVGARRGKRLIPPCPIASAGGQVQRQHRRVSRRRVMSASWLQPCLHSCLHAWPAAGLLIMWACP